MTGNLQLTLISDENIKQLFTELIKQNFEQFIMTQSSTPNLVWLQQVWKVLIQRGIDSFAGLPILPILMKGKWQAEYTVKLVSLNSNYLLLREHSGYEPISSELCEALQWLGIYIVTELPNWIPIDSVKKYISLPSSEGIKHLLGKIAKSDKAKGAVERFNENVTEAKRKEVVFRLGECSNFDQATIHFLSKLRMFCSVQEKSKTGSYQSVGVVMMYIDDSVEKHFPVGVQYPHCYLRVSAEEERLLQQFSCRKVNLVEVVKKTLERIVVDAAQKEITDFMNYFLTHFGLFENCADIVEIAKTVPFLRVGKNWRVPGDVFDPSNVVLTRIFSGEKVFPELDTNLPEKQVMVLRRLGMKTLKDVTCNDLFKVGKTLDRWIAKGKSEDLIVEKASAFLSFIVEHPKYLTEKCGDNSTLSLTLQPLCCFPYFLKNPSGVSYPELLIWYKHPTPLCKPLELTIIDNWQCVGSTMPIVNVQSKEVIQCFGWNKPPQIEKVLEQLQEIRKVRIVTEKRSEVFVMLKTIYNALSERQQEVLKYKSDFEECGLIWTGEEFKAPNAVVLEQKKKDIDIRPYMYFLPQELKKFHCFFKQIGCHQQQTVSILLAIIDTIRKKYEEINEFSPGTVQRDREVVNAILDRLADLKQNGTYDIKAENVYIMTECNDENRIAFCLVTKCSFDDDPQGEFDDDEVENVIFIHRTVNIKTAMILGVKSIKQQCFMEAEEVGLQEWGQNERLTERIKTLLREGYSDGLSIPKELVQNADDAGAKTVKFMYDERDNVKHSRRLFTRKMAECHGPSLWVYNDSQFSQDDLESITKLNGATKSADSTKIGKFGLGFCSVYNITDVPSFISGNHMVVFDPHETYLKDARATRGLKVKLSNRKIVKLHEDQFKPFEQVFGCKVLDPAFSGYQGTLFRLPLRTLTQANESEISKKAYTEEEMKTLLKMLIENAGHLLLFAQNVLEIEVYHLPKNAELPSEADLLFRLSKTNLDFQDINQCKQLQGRDIPTMTHSVLRHFSNIFRTKNDEIAVQKVKLLQKLFQSANSIVRLEQDVLEHIWMVTWAMIAGHHSYEKGSLPLAAVACPLTKTSPLLFKQISADLHLEGHVFCFMPLPITTGLHFHINGCFSVTSDRHNLITISGDSKDNTLAKWNDFILAGPLTKAFVTHLYQLQTTELSCEEYYDIWPNSSADVVRTLEKSFYRAVVAENPSVFKGIDQFIGFENVICLHSDVSRDCKLEEIAREVISAVPIREGQQLVSIPLKILNVLKKYNEDKHTLIDDIIIMEEEFLIHCLNNIEHGIWEKKRNERDYILAKVLGTESDKIQSLLLKTKCIPTEPNGSLKRITDVIHPSAGFADLFDEADEVFPTSHFQKKEFLQKLELLGMNTKQMSGTMLLDRCRSVHILARTCTTCTLDRIVNIFRYISSKDVLTNLKNSSDIFDEVKDCFLLPVLEKPDDWSFTWKLEEDACDVLRVDKSICQKHAEANLLQLVLAKPNYLFRKSLLWCVGSVACVLDEGRFAENDEIFVDESQCFRILGVQKKVSVDIALQQLNVISDTY